MTPGVGGNPDLAQEGAPERFGGAVADGAGHGSNGEVTAFQQPAGVLDADLLDVASRRHADLGGEGAGKLPARQPDPAGDGVEAEIAGRVGVDERAGGADRVAAGRLGPHRCGELGLASRAAQEHDQPPGDGLGNVGAEVVLDECDREVDPGGHPGRGPDRAVAVVQGVGLDPHGRVPVGQLRRSRPVGGDRAPVQQTGGGQHERARAHRTRSPGAPGRGREPGEQGRVPGGVAHPVAAGHDDGVAGLIVEPMVGVQHESALGADPSRLAGGDPHRVRRVLPASDEDPVGGVEYLVRPGQVEGLHAGEGDHDDGAHGGRHPVSVRPPVPVVNDTSPTDRARAGCPARAGDHGVASPAVSERITIDDVAHVAKLARLELPPEQLAHYAEQLAGVLEHFADIDALDLSGVEPMTQPFPLVNVLRDDVEGPTLDRDEVLAAAPAALDGRFRVPPVLGGEP